MITPRIIVRRSGIVAAVAFTGFMIAGILGAGFEHGGAAQNQLRMATFEADATPPLGVPMAYNPTKRIEMPLSAKGVVLVGNGDPIVLLTVDWIGVYNEPNNIWRRTLAEAAGTTPERVTIHALHQHDAPRANFSSAEVLAEFGRLEDTDFDNREFVEATIQRTANALRDAVENNLQPITHVGTGTAVVEKVASNRRVVGRDGTVPWRRNSSTSDVEAKNFPVGTIDPEVMLLSLWNNDEPLAILSYYATHPQSYYRTGGANPDFPGIAREAREKETGIKHIHFNGAGGNIAAGKWNRGWTETRQLLADRLAKGMAEAWDNTVRTPVDAAQLEWRVEPVVLPPRKNLDEQELIDILNDDAADDHGRAARELAFLRRHQDGINLTALRLGPARVVHTPGELAVEYQLFARSLYPNDFVTNASYTYMAAGYISTEIQYHQGSYEAVDRSSRVAPEVEQVLLEGIRKVLAFGAFEPHADRLTQRGYRLERSAVQAGYDGEYSWVNGRAGVIPAHVTDNPIGKPSVVLLAHEVEHSGPDEFQGLHYFRSRDLGLNWAGPFEEVAFERRSLADDDERDRLVTDFTPGFHRGSEKLLGIGHSAVFDENDLLIGQPREIVYAVFDEPDQTWTAWKTFELPDDLSGESSPAASGRRVDLDNGSTLFPVYSTDAGDGQLHVTVVRGRFDGTTLEYSNHGNTLSAAAGARSREPSLTKFGGTYFLTFGNDDEVYVASSDNGLEYSDPRPLLFDDGQRLVSGDAGQHWVTHSSKLYLAYTRQDGASLLLSQVKPGARGAMSIVRGTEQTIVPASRSGRLDNIDVTDIDENATWVFTTEWGEPTVVGGQYAFDNIIHVARLNWLEPNTRTGN